ncbi:MULTISPECIES: ABC transporter permease [Raoultella]|jgi:glutathione transport system permease protein|uniref:ABC transporter permease n=1 Tax=Raoultella terrigena TaxID=577 RepID=A0A1V2BV25_RAOTE|nr:MULTISPECIES: ABC transporter permease [Raoultella]AJF72899.1 diguanylate cyclase [Raoultella ornithinolytica]HCR57232.1 ABC transporter permease [Raoultella sp.]MCI1035582.1 ABC transporter permease [Raoultella terrigena]MCS4269596.1 glutathione transport system permease protein [Raoultella sp. BIGb0132]MCS4286555.1 glutathione transport system permease protein [Raoultella terrigena]
MSEISLAKSRNGLMNGLRWGIDHPSIAIGGFIVALIVLGALFAPWLSHYDPYDQDLLNILSAPSAEHWLGTDDYGRDIFSRIIYGARISLIEVVVSVALSLAMGLPLGIMAALCGKSVDHIIMWIMDVIFAFPGIVLAILLVSVLGAGLINMLLAIAIFSVPVYARLSRNLTLGIKNMEYMEAARALGIGYRRQIIHYILRNTLGPITVQATLTGGSVILAAASLSFLGMGVQPPMPEWGTMMSDGRNFLGISLGISLWPGLAIVLSVLGFNILGDGLRDLLDTRL